MTESSLIKVWMDNKNLFFITHGVCVNAQVFFHEGLPPLPRIVPASLNLKRLELYGTIFEKRC